MNLVEIYSNNCNQPNIYLSVCRYDECILSHLLFIFLGSVLACGKTRQVADIAIVPLMGFPVDVTVSEILTNAWLVWCLMFSL